MSKEGVYWEINLTKFLLLFVNSILTVRVKFSNTIYAFYKLFVTKKFSNFFFFNCKQIIGLGLSIMGVLGLCNKHLLKSLQVATVNNNIDLIKVSSGLLIGLGVFVIVIAAFGLFGAIKGNIGLLTIVRKECSFLSSFLLFYFFFTNI